MYASQTYHSRRPVVPRIVHILQETICIVAVPMQAVFTMKTIPWLPSAAISDLRLSSSKSKNPPRLLGKNSYEIVRGSEFIMATPILKETDHFRRMHIDHLEWRGTPSCFKKRSMDGSARTAPKTRHRSRERAVASTDFPCARARLQQIIRVNEFSGLD